MTPSQRSPSARARPSTSARPASDSAIERFTFLRLWVSDADMKTLISSNAGRPEALSPSAASASSRPRPFGMSTDTLTSAGTSIHSEDLARVGELRDHIGADEARDLEPLDARARERVDQLDLALGRDDLGLVLEPVTRPDLPDPGRLCHPYIRITDRRMRRSARRHMCRLAPRRMRRGELPHRQAAADPERLAGHV